MTNPTTPTWTTPPTDPTQEAGGWPEGTFDITTLGVVADTGADQRTAIQSAIDGRSAGQSIGFPAGTYTISNYLTPKAGVKLYGEPGRVSRLYMASGTAKSYFYYSSQSPRLLGAEWHDLAFISDYVNVPTHYGININGATDCTINKCYGENLNRLLNLGSNYTSTGWTVTDITTRHNTMSFYLDYVSNSYFARFDLEGSSPYGGANTDHCFYIHSAQDCLFEDFTLRMGTAYGFHIWPDGGTATRLTFNRVLADCTGSGNMSPFVIGGDGASPSSYITVNDLTAIGIHAANDAMVLLYAPTFITINGFQSDGTTYMVRTYGSVPSDITFRNGNFNGEAYLYPGNTITRLDYSLNVTRNGATRPVPLPELPRG